MKFSLSFAFGLAAFSFCLFTSLRAEDWTTTDGKVYQNVTVVKTEPDAVTITHHDGGALVPLAKLSPDLQKRFNYDPAKAKAAADARTQGEAKNAVALQAEMDKARDQKQAAIIATDPRAPAPRPSPVLVSHNSPTGAFDPMGQPNDSTESPQSAESTDSTASSTTEVITSPEDQNLNPQVPAATAPTSKSNAPFDLTSDPLATDPNDIKHHSTDELVDVNSRLKDDHPSPNRHTASSLLLKSSYLMPDPLDTNHHSTDELLHSSSLAKPKDPNSN